MNTIASSAHTEHLVFALARTAGLEKIMADFP